MADVYKRQGLSFETLDAIQAKTGDMPLVLHGGTGIPADMIKKAIDLGVAKIKMCIRDSYKVLSARDYKLDTIKNVATGEVTPTGLPASNVLYYDMNDNAWLCIRPSGTEPKIKFYYGVKGTSLEDADAKSAALGEALMAMVDKLL